MQIIIFGAPGVGKGTQAKLLAAKLNLAHISTGDILREAIKNETEMGLKAKEIVQSGGLVPDEIVGGIVKETLKDERCKNGFILDGFPRTINQAEILNKILLEISNEQLYLIKLNADDNVIISRLSNRLVCNKCGNILNKNEVTDNFKCSVCGELNSYVKRKDDDEEVIKKRLQVYHETTAPVFNYYKDKAIIIEVDGTQPIEDVTKDILEKLKVN
ncbi:adenylate kinase [Rosettibacter firmus]|uniref:adenylate kinase n=1 Tax=Rosettibacter firmus TaxID=3111522 RepID=UPI00336C1410